MKKLILPCLASVAIASLAACSHTTVEPAAQPAPAMSTTQTTTPASTTTTTTQQQTPTTSTTTTTTP